MISYRMLERFYLLGAEVRPNFPMKCATSLGIGGSVEALIVPNTLDSAREIIRMLNETGEKYRIMGFGTNLLVSDEGLEGAVIRTTNLGSFEIRGDLLVAESGVPLKRLCLVALEHSLSGLEELFGIPGSLGGAVRMNAGAYGKEISEIIEWVELFDGNRAEKFSPDDLGMSYRNGGVGGRFVTRVALKLKRSSRDSIESAMKDFLARRISRQPIFDRSAGSLFKRPRPDFYVGKAIEDLGLKGYRVGDVMISEKHAGFMVNVGNGRFEDALELIDEVKKAVMERHGVKLETEVIIWR